MVYEGRGQRRRAEGVVQSFAGYLGVIGSHSRRPYFLLSFLLIFLTVIKVRSVYRVIEFALGINGYPFTHEWIFYVFEALPMLPAISVFCFVHPAKYLGSKGGLNKIERVEERGVELLEADSGAERFNQGGRK